MDHPHYTFTVTSLSRGWSYASVEAAGPSTDDPARRVVLGAPFKYSWSFDNDQIPGLLNPFTAEVNLEARTGADVPVVQIGDLLQFDLRIGTTGKRIIAPPPMRVVDAEVELTPNRLYAATLSIGLVDLAADWRGVSVDGVNHAANKAIRFPWRERLAELAKEIGVSIGAPTWWSQTEGPPAVDPGHRSMKSWWWNDFRTGALDAVEAVVNSHAPGGYYHTPTTIYAPAGHPAGYAYVGPSTWESNVNYETPPADVASTARVELVEASRRAIASTHPMHLAYVAGLMTIEPAARPARGAGGGYGLVQLGIDAGWCKVPAKARRAREQQVNRVELTASGQKLRNDGSGIFDVQDVAYIAVNPTTSARGTITRQVDTDLFAGGNPVGELHAGVPAAQAVFMADQSVFDAPWTYDAFEVHSDLIPQAVADWLLPMIAPRLPGEIDGDGRLVRHVMVFGLGADVRIDGPVVGFVTAGSLTVNDGVIVFNLTTAPGTPQWVSGTPPVPLTVGQFTTAASTWGIEYREIDPQMRWADLDYTAYP